MNRTLLAAAAALLGAGCNLAIGGFKECEVDSGCSGGRVCSQGFCVVPPAGCAKVSEGELAKSLGTHGKPDDPNAIWIGASLPFTLGDSVDQLEVHGLNAVLLALKEINQREGVAGKPFALQVCDSLGDSARIKEHVAWFAEVRKVPAIYTSGSSQTLAAMGEAKERGLMVITATATSPELSSYADNNLLWRTAPSDLLQGRVIADLMLDRVPGGVGAPFNTVGRLAILYLDDPYGQGLNNVIVERYGTPAGKTLKSFQFAGAATGADPTAQVRNLNSFDPDLTILIGFANDIRRILDNVQTINVADQKLTRAAGHRWFFTDSGKDPSINNIQVPAEVYDAYGTGPAQGAGVAFQTFEDRFASEYGTTSKAYAFTSHAYDAMYLLALSAAYAVRDGSGALTGARMAEGMTKMGSGPNFPLTPTDFSRAKAALQQGQSIDVRGTSGELQFDATGDPAAPIELWQHRPGDPDGPFVTRNNITPPAN